MTTMAELAPAWVWGLATLGCVVGIIPTSQGVLPPRLKMRLGRRIAQDRETLDPDSFDDSWELDRLEAIAAGRECFWFGKK